MRSILVIDDNLRASAVATAVVGPRGGVVDTARDGVEALRLMALQPFDAVLIELVLPSLDAFSTISTLRDRWPACRIVAMSADGRLAQASEVLQVARVLGAHAFLAKPVTAEALADALQIGDPQPQPQPRSAAR